MAFADFANGQRAVATAQQTMVTVETRFLAVDNGSFAATWGNTELAVTNILIPQRLGQTQILKISFSPINHPYGADYKGTVTIALSDKAFEEYNLFGQRKTAEDKKLDKAAKQGEF